jgi:hypothetical protein
MVATLWQCDGPSVTIVARLAGRISGGNAARYCASAIEVRPKGLGVEAKTRA